MKKILYVVLALVLVLAFAVPVTAADPIVTTEVTISSGGGQIPLVKCKWEQDLTGSLEDGDPTHLNFEPTQRNSWFLPPLIKGMKKTVKYLAVVTDEEDSGNVLNVYADIFHPTSSPPPYNASADPKGPLFKYKVDFAKVGHTASAIAVVKAAYNAKLLYFAPGITIDEITNVSGTGEMDKGTADLWMGTADLDYEQPAGEYLTRVFAIDHNNNQSAVLENHFLYIPLCGIELDFNALNYGQINLSSPKVVAGDRTWNTPIAGAPTPNPATVRNIGNTWTHVKVTQNDMTFGFAGAPPPTTYQGATAPTAVQSTWNVVFDARMGNNDTYRMWYDPNVTVTLPNYLGLSLMEELDFSIHVKQGFGLHSGSMTIGCSIEPFSPTGTPTGVPDP